MAYNKIRWGWNQAEGVWFFFELGRPLQPLCPLKPPKEDLLCPHRTPEDIEPLSRTEPAIYWTTKPVNFDSKYEVKHSRVKYFGTGTIREMNEMAKETNYIPIIVSSARITPDWYMFTLKLEQFIETYGRSVILELVDEFVPVLPSWKKLEDFESLGLKGVENEKTSNI